MGIWIRSQDRKTLSNGNTKIYIRISNSGFGIDWECLANDYNGTQRLKVGVDKVFVMPQDSEVIVDET